MTELVTSFLLSISSFLGVSSYPGQDSNWNITKFWIQDSENRLLFEANSNTLARKCNENLSGIVKLPQVIHGVHELFLDGKLILQSGDPTFNTASSFYDHPKINCSLLANGKTVIWKIYSYSKYFSRFSVYPKITNNPDYSVIFDIYFNMIAFGSLFLMSLFSYYLFIKRIDKSLVRSMILGASFFSFYFLMCISPLFSIKFSMLNAHKFADISLFISVYFYFKIINKLGFLSKSSLNVFKYITIINCLVITFGNTGDVIQFGTSSNLPFVMLSMIQCFYLSVKLIYKDKTNKVAWLASSSILIFVFTSSSDIIHIFGLSNAYMVGPIGAISCFFLLFISANEQIENTYKERDALLVSLESKVQEKTKDLNQALESLKSSQAELVQSAKLASLGTLSAGIAHEINNSINFVNGAIVPLEKKVIKHIPEGEKESISKLFNVIKQGTDLTVQIVRSLRNFTGLNQASFRDIKVEEVISSVLTILRSKLVPVKLSVQIENDLSFEGSQVGVSQAIMNIISNAIDSLPNNNPEIIITAKLIDEFVEISITDNGSGIPENIKTRIFDPFFTTKQVGKGTGLGLFIVKKEMDRHNGTIVIKSEAGRGSTFILVFKKKNKSLESSMSLEAA